MSGFWKKLWQLIDFSHKEIKVLVGFIVVFEGIRLIGPYLLKIIIDELIDFRIEKISLLLLLIAGMFITEEAASIFAYIKDKRIFKILINIQYHLPVRAQKKLVSLSLNYHEKENTGNKITKVRRGVDKIDQLIGNVSWEVFPTFIQLIMTSAILFWVDWRFGATFIVFAPTFIWITYQTNRDLYPTRKQRYKDSEEASGKMGQSIININTVQSFVQEKREAREYETIEGMIRANELKEWFQVLRANLKRNFVVDFGRIAILLLGVFLVWRGQVSIGTLVFVVTLSEKSFFSLYRLTRFYDKIQESAVAVDRFISIPREEPGIKNSTNGLKPKNIKGEIEFKNTSFLYDESNNKALDNVNFKIKAGTINAFVGPSGGGKTTIARMIYRHYDPQEGAILLDNQDLRKYNLHSFRQFISIVPQEVELFNDTISANISYGNPKASLSEIKRAAHIANADEFIRNLTEGYETKIGERGIKLSGGQRQRIGIARAILPNPRILIFDEATSNLDSHSEKLIQEAMEKISQSRTVIMIAHRLSTIRHADQIFVLEDGKLVEQGSHAELSDVAKGLYAKLLNLQRSGDVD